MNEDSVGDNDMLVTLWCSPPRSFVTNRNVADIIDLGLIQLSSDSEESTNKSYKIKRYNLFRHLGNLFNPAGY